MQNKDYEWFIKADFKNYEGEYLAILNKKIIAHGKNPSVVWKKAKNRFPKRTPTMWKVPKGDLLVL